MARGPEPGGFRRGRNADAGPLPPTARSLAQGPSPQGQLERSPADGDDSGHHWISGAGPGILVVGGTCSGVTLATGAALGLLTLAVYPGLVGPHSQGPWLLPEQSVTDWSGTPSSELFRRLLGTWTRKVM